MLEQDRRVLEALPYDADKHEHRYQHDDGLARARLLMRQEAKAQLETLRFNQK